MWEAYQQTVAKSPLDWVILTLGITLIIAHIIGLIGNRYNKGLFFNQNLNRYREFCHLATELLPVLGLLGTVFSLMYTFSSFQNSSESGTPDISKMIQTFAPAMSTTISGLMMIAPNLLLNAVLGLACESDDK
jgi:hypothetical protein